MAGTALCERFLHSEGELRRQGEELIAGERVLNRDRELLPQLSESSGLGFALYAGNRRIASATVLDAGVSPEVGAFASAELVDKVLRRREIFKGTVAYTERDYLCVARPLYATEGEDFAPIGMVEAFQDKQAYFDLLTAAARAGVEDQLSAIEEQSDGLHSIINFIDDVSRRLQLLALNGNIIAAQAGEHGRAFRVVCRELGSLAQQSKSTAGDVRKMVTAMGLDQDFESVIDADDEEYGEGDGSRDARSSEAAEDAEISQSSSEPA